MFIGFYEYTNVPELLGLVDRIDAVVNAANTTVTFGGGVSGAIGNATRQAALINAEAQRSINEFNQRITANIGRGRRRENNIPNE